MTLGETQLRANKVSHHTGPNGTRRHVLLSIHGVDTPITDATGI